MLYYKYHRLVVEEKDVTTVLTAINRHQGFFSNPNKLVGNCGWASQPTKWYVSFYASDREWGKIAGSLSELGGIAVKVNPGGTTDLYLTRK